MQKNAKNGEFLKKIIKLKVSNVYCLLFYLSKTFKYVKYFFMEYVLGKNYFFNKDNALKPYPYLNRDLECEILIIGGGINGAILNYYLSKNHNVVMIDKGRFGCCLTSVATALLEYQLDNFADELKNEMSKQDIVDCYNLGLIALKKLDNLINKIGNKCFYHKRPSLVYSNNKKDDKKIEKEFLFRKSYGFDCELITKDNNPFEFEISRGIFCKNGGAEFDPYLFTKQLIENSFNQEQLFENTKAVEYQNKGDYVIVKTPYATIKAQKVIISTGFDFELIDREIAQRFVSYSIIAQSKRDIKWLDNTLIQDANSPYHYLRILPNKKLIFGGEDISFNQKYLGIKKAEKKYQKLFNFLKKMFPNNQFVCEEKFCGMFATTPNNMGCIGRTKDKNILYFFSCGANGILNAIFCTDLIEDILFGRQNKYEKIFSPLRNL